IRVAGKPRPPEIGGAEKPTIGKIRGLPEDSFGKKRAAFKASPIKRDLLGEDSLGKGGAVQELGVLELCPPREHRSREINRVGKNMPCEINVAYLSAIQGRSQRPARVRKKRKDFILTKEAHDFGFPSYWFLPYNGILQGHDPCLVRLAPDQL